jgi:signal transduction histidine kinase
VTQEVVSHAHGAGLSPTFGLWANLLIGLSYVVISGCLVALVRRLRGQIPYRWLFGLFGLFIIACGSGHLAAAAGLSVLSPLTDASIAFITVIASVVTAALMPFLVPAIARAVRDARAAAAQRVEIAALEQANKTKAQFMAAMSHELRTPLNAIIGYAELLESGVGGPMTEAQRAQLSRIGMAGRHLTSLVDDVLDFERMGAGRYEVQLKPEDVVLVAEEALQLMRPLAQAKQLTLAALLPPAGLKVTTDGRAVRQILLNLLSNAIKYTPSGHIELTVAWETDVLRIHVSDSGIGIAPDDIRHAFEPFWQADQSLTREAGGAGLGLPITRSLVERIGGSITLNSEVGRGTRVSVELPAPLVGQSGMDPRTPSGEFRALAG